jgi:type I restriction enzyme M protein
MTVICRLDAVRELTKEAVLQMKRSLDEEGIVNLIEAQCNAAGQAFCNTSPLTKRTSVESYATTTKG